MPKNKVLVAGASGLVGLAAVRHFRSLPGWDVVGVSRRRPPGLDDVEIVQVDLTDRARCAEVFGAMRDVTHVVYAALYEKDELIAGWRDPEQMRVNDAMLRNLFDPLRAAAGGLSHVTLLQGTKAYGVHLHPVAVPARESTPRDAHENFYWLQEDHLRAQAARHGFGFTIFRPQLVFGDALGVAMNLVPVIGAYAAVCRELGLPFAYPGGPSNILEATDARLLARALAWTADAPAARNQIFNVTNGDVFVWRNLWPALADALGVSVGPDEPRSMAEFMPAQAAVWERVVQRHGLQPMPMQALLGESHHYADFCFGWRAREAPPPVIVSTIKLRQAGFGDCIDTEQMFREWFARLQQRKVLPPR